MGWGRCGIRWSTSERAGESPAPTRVALTPVADPNGKKILGQKLQIGQMP